MTAKVTVGQSPQNGCKHHIITQIEYIVVNSQQHKLYCMIADDETQN